MHFFAETDSPLMIGSRLALIIVFVGGLLAAGCEPNAGSSSQEAPSPTDTLTLDTKADSVADRLMTSYGADALATAPYLRFTFAFETPKQSRVIGRHLWDRTTGDYRVEWQSGVDSTYVALINVRGVEDEMPEGEVYLNGEKLSGDRAQRMKTQAYGRFVNDTYWLLAPLKVFDAGVNREYLADSSTAEHDVLYLTFGDVGLTPDDEYWLYVSKKTGQLDRWAYRLQSMEEDASPRPYDWTADTTLQAPGGSVTLARRKEAVGAEQALLTNELALPSSPSDGVFTNPDPMLGTGSTEK